MTGIGNGPKIVFEIGSLRITETVVMGWLIIVAVLILCLWLTHDLSLIHISTPRPLNKGSQC